MPIRSIKSHRCEPMALLTLVACLFIFNTLEGQSLSDSDSSNTRKTIIYNAYAHHNVNHIITGKEYDDHFTDAINSRFFHGSYPEAGQLIYDGVFYPKIDIQYDTYGHEVVVLLESTAGSQLISIDKEKITQFSFNGYLFKMIKNDSTISNGLYQILYQDGNTILLSKRGKEKTERIEYGVHQVIFDPKNKFYIKKRSGTFEVSNKKDLYQAYSKNKKVVEVIKKSRAKFSSKYIEASLLKVIPQLHQISGQ